jgi:hypothetical protein
MDIEYQILILIFLHWVGDFLLQNTDMATNKSKSNIWLFKHVMSYSLVWIFAGVWFFPPHLVVIFFFVTFIAHFTTDYYTSRWTNKLYANKKFYGFPAFFSVIGLDQWLHYLQLILTYKFLTSL